MSDSVFQDQFHIQPIHDLAGRFWPTVFVKTRIDVSTAALAYVVAPYGFLRFQKQDSMKYSGIINQEGKKEKSP